MIAVDRLCKNFGDVDALRGVSFDAADGEVLGVLGLNGAGKSTLLRIIAGDLAPSSGAVKIAGADQLDAGPEARLRVGFLPEGAPLYGEMRVRQLLRWAGGLRGLKRRALRTRIDEVATQTHITQVMNRTIAELSMGYRKRVGIAQTILHRPPLLILDEPISALDPAEIIGMRTLIRSLGGDHTVVVSSHILNEVHETCDRLLVLQDGALAAVGTESQLRKRHGGARAVALTLTGDEAAVRSALPSTLTIDSFRKDSKGRFKVVLQAKGREREALIAALVAGGIGVREMRLVRDDLERLFLNLVARDGDEPLSGVTERPKVPAPQDGPAPLSGGASS